MSERVCACDILSAVASYYGMTTAVLRGPRRQKSIARARQISMYLARQLTLMSYPEIGREIGGRDHSTVIHAVRSVTERLSEDTALRAEIDAIKSRLCPSLPDGEAVCASNEVSS